MDHLEITYILHSKLDVCIEPDEYQSKTIEIETDSFTIVVDYTLYRGYREKDDIKFSYTSANVFNSDGDTLPIEIIIDEFEINELINKY